MKKARILISILVCAVLAASVLSGCGSNAGGGTEPAKTASTQEASTTVSNQEPTVIKYLGVTWGQFLADTPGNKRIHDALLEKLNIDVQNNVISNPDDWGAKINLALSSGEKYDLLYLPNDNNYQLYGQLVEQDYLLPLEDLLNSRGKNLLANQRPEVLEYLKRDGKMYGWANESEPNVICTGIRKDLLDKYQLAMPTTIEEYETTVMKIQENEKGMTGYLFSVPSWDSLDETFAQAFVETGTSDWLDPKDNKIKPYYLAPGFTDYLATMARFYKEGILPREFITMKPDEVQNISKAGKAITIVSFGPNNAPWSDIDLAKVVPDGEYVALKPLKGTVNGGYIADIGAVEPFAIPKESKVAEKVMDYVDYVVGTVEGYALVGFGQDGFDFFAKSVSADKVVADSEKAKSLVRGPDMYSGIYRAGVTNSMRRKVVLDIAEKWFSAVSEFKLHKPVDYGVSYDTSKFQSKDSITTLIDLYDQERNKVIVGQTSAADWDKNFVQKFFSLGGSQYIDDFTQQYNAAKAKK